MFELSETAYSTYFFEMAGIGRPFEDTCIMAGIGSFFLLVNSAIITKYGRRRVFLGWGLIFGGIAQLIMAAIYTAYPKTKLAGKVSFHGYSSVPSDKYLTGHCKLFNYQPCLLQHNDCNLCKASWWGATISEPSLVHTWNRHCNRFFPGMASIFHSPLLHKPCFSQLG